MSNTTTNAAVRSTDTDSYQVVTKATGTGTETVIARAQMVGYATGVTVNTTAGDSPAIGQFTQPAGTLLTHIDVWCTLAPTLDSAGDIGYEVGTTSSGAQIVAAQTDELLDAGTTVTINAVAQTALVQVTQDDVTFAVSAQYTAADRTIYCNITNTVDAATAGSFTFLIRYMYVG